MTEFPPIDTVDVILGAGGTVSVQAGASGIERVGVGVCPGTSVGVIEGVVLGVTV